MRRTLGDALDAFGRWTVRRRGIALLLVLLVTVAALGAAAVRVQREGMPLDFTPQAIFMDEGEALERMETVEAVFGKDDNDLVLLVQGPLGTEAGVEALRRLHAAMAAHPRVERVTSAVEATVTEAEGGVITVVQPLDELPPDEALARIARDPTLGGLLVSEDADTAAVRVRVDRELERVADLGPVVWELVDLARAVPLAEGMRVVPTGVPYVRAEVVDLMQDNQSTYIPVVAGLFAITICLLFRRVLLGLAPLVCVLVADAWAMGAIIGSGQVLNILSILVPTLVLVIGVADGIHITARYTEELAREEDPELAMGQTLRAMALPCFLTTFTTAAGFLSLLVAETAVMRSFGIQAAIAMGVTFFAVLVVLPVLLAFIPPRRVGSPGQTHPLFEERALAGINRLVARRPAAVLGAAGLVTLVAAAVGSRVGTDSRLLEMYSEGMETHQAVRLAEEELSGVVPVFFYVETAPGGVLDPDLLARMRRVELALQQEDAVLWTASLAGQVERLHGQLTGEPGLPGTREAVAQELLLAEMSGEEPLAGLVDEGRGRARVMALLSDAGGQEYLRIQREIEALATRELRGLPGVDWALTGDGLLAASGVDRLIRDLLWSLALVFAIILAMFLVLLRDLRLALVAMVPNLVPLVFTLATLGVMGADLQTSNIVSFTVAVGLAVDDTIHFVVRYRHERLSGVSVREAMRWTFLGAGHAIVVTSVLLVIGFSVLATSDLTSTRHFGILAAVTMGAALLGDLFVLPALIHLVEGRSGRQQQVLQAAR